MREICFEKKYDPDKCGEQMKKLGIIYSKEEGEEWSIALSEGKKRAYDMLHEDPNGLEILRDRERREAFEMMVAENLMVEKGFRPPHWSGHVNCENCGQMPADKEFQGDALAGCPWCVGKATRPTLPTEEEVPVVDEFAWLEEYAGCTT